MSIITGEELLPDFEDMDKLVQELTFNLGLYYELKQQLEETIAICIREAHTNNNLWVNGKPPTGEYSKTVISFIGNNMFDTEMLSKLRRDSESAYTKYESVKQLLQNLRDRIAVWQTMSANKRIGMV